ncbi:serpin-ZX-like [Rhododendron vialii]|uniref:serpin-ZX-like n=1 Tax=Rhododendron vialii TaxID=182163 RepID=UPI00265D65D6|nr:serpin-ZX-like [Rhododendron vialii]
MEFCPRIANELMLKEIQKGSSSKNTVSSPLSINAVLNMLVAGSKGDTLKQMLGFLGSKNVDEINSKSRQMMAMLRGGGGSSENVDDGPIVTIWSMELGLINIFLSFLNTKRSVRASFSAPRLMLGALSYRPLWLCPTIVLYQVMITRTSILLKFHVFILDNVMCMLADQVVDEINSWANTASRGLIKNILQRGSVPIDTTLILANGLYFKGLWDYPYKFEALRTTNRKFYLLNGDNVSVPFMTSYEKYYYRAFDGFKFLKIPYQSRQNNNFSMYFFLPDERDGLQNLHGKFNSDSGFLNEEHFELKNETLEEFWIPKFKFSFDFDVSKKAYIEVDENGTEAAAINYMRMRGGGCWPPPGVKCVSFVADHPFIFMIREEGSGLVFFTGAVVQSRDCLLLVQGIKNGRALEWPVPISDGERAVVHEAHALALAMRNEDSSSS